MVPAAVQVTPLLAGPAAAQGGRARVAPVLVRALALQGLAPPASAATA